MEVAEQNISREEDIMNHGGFDSKLDTARIQNDYLSAEQYQRCCDQVWGVDRRSSFCPDKSRPLHGTIVYAKRDLVHSLFATLKKGRSRVLLVSAESDVAVECAERTPPQVAVWFSTNSCHPGVKPLPLGLGNSYCNVTAKADLLAEYGGRSKTSLLYVNFRPETNPEARMPLWNSFGSLDWNKSVTRHAGNVSKEEYVSTLASHRFALCPRGNGIDTHRMWESLYVGTIPVVERDSALESFSDLPILFVDKLARLDPCFLESKYQEMIEKSWNWEKLFLPWWRMRFEEERDAIKGRVSWRDYWQGRFQQPSISRY